MNMMVSTLSLKAGRAVSPAELPVIALEKHLDSTDIVDPFASLHDRVMALQDAINNGDESEEEKDEMMEEWARIDAEALAGRPTTLGGSLGALQRARHEFVQFQMDGIEETNDPSRRLLLHLMDGVLGVLRQETIGKAA